MVDDDSAVRLAASQSEEKRQIKCAQDEIEWRTRTMAANMIRVIRGAGEPLYLFDHVVALANAMRDCPENTTVGQINDAMVKALGDGLDHSDWSCNGGYREIERGALRAVAARILDQTLQIKAGERDLRDGMRTIEAYYERRRSQRIAAETESRKAERAARKASRPAKSVKVRAAPAVPLTPVAPEPKPVSTSDYMKINAKRIREGKEPI